MADFCQQCSLEVFGEDTKDMAGLCAADEVVQVLCEDCGPAFVTHEGYCVGPCMKPEHRQEWDGQAGQWKPAPAANPEAVAATEGSDG